MGVKGVKVSYSVTGNMARAREFYERGLGLRPTFADGEHWAQYAVGNSTFAIAGPQEAARNAVNAVVVFEVDDLDAACRQAVAAGGSLDSLRDMDSHGRTATLIDPDGNVLQLFSR